MATDLATLDLAGLTAEAGRLGLTLPEHYRGCSRLVAPIYRCDCGRTSGGTHEADLWRELLETPEARRLAAIVDAAEARGRDAERAAVVAWLRAAVAAYRGTHAEDALADTLRDVMAGDHARGGE